MTQIKIDKLDNGYVVSYVKYPGFNSPPETVALIFNNMDEVVKHLAKEFK
jgi:predicted RNase H-like HicB family nuclease